MPFHIWIVGPLVAAGSIGVAASQPYTINAAKLEGPGVLTKCFIMSRCRIYHHIVLPPRIAIGDTITVSFGSSPKSYRFPIARITLDGNHCHIFSKTDRDQRRADKISVTPCYAADDEP